MADEDDIPGYSRSKFPHWITQYGTCDTCEVTPRRDGQDVVQDDQCRAVSGTWYSEYNGKTITSASGIDIDIDHVVPLKEAWRSGASQWTTPKRRAFANDLADSQLIAVSAGSNRGKGDKDPGNWKPPLQSYWCTYSRARISVKATYQLTANRPRPKLRPRCSTPATSDPTRRHRPETLSGELPENRTNPSVPRLAAGEEQDPSAQALFLCGDPTIPTPQPHDSERVRGGRLLGIAFTWRISRLPRTLQPIMVDSLRG
ncbi:HNH endonuclease family protein [Streptomyces sp. TE4109]